MVGVDCGYSGVVLLSRCVVFAEHAEPFLTIDERQRTFVKARMYPLKAMTIMVAQYLVTLKAESLVNSSDRYIKELHNGCHVNVSYSKGCCPMDCYINMEALKKPGRDCAERTIQRGWSSGCLHFGPGMVACVSNTAKT